MFRKFSDILQVAAVFIGTIVGAGLASGKEISNFFTYYGYKSFLGIILCGLLYIFVYYFIIEITEKYNLKSYKQLIDLISPDIIGNLISLFTSFFLIGGAAIIMAGSGAILNQYFGFSKWIGILLMIIFTIIVLLKDTTGLIEINSFIVPSLIIVLSTVFLLYVKFLPSIDINYLKGIKAYKSAWPVSTVLYSAFNILSSSGVIVPLALKYRDKKTMHCGVILGAFALTLLCIAINFMLLVNVPSIYTYEIPLLFICKKFGVWFQFILLSIIWLEMFSTEISDIYSLCKMLENISFIRTNYNSVFSKHIHNFFGNLSYKNSIFLIILIAIPISQVGFSRLIELLYPTFGVISIFFIIKCIIFYFKEMRD